MGEKFCDLLCMVAEHTDFWMVLLQDGEVPVVLSTLVDLDTLMNSANALRFLESVLPKVVGSLLPVDAVVKLMLVLAKKMQQYAHAAATCTDPAEFNQVLIQLWQVLRTLTVLMQSPELQTWFANENPCLLSDVKALIIRAAESEIMLPASYKKGDLEPSARSD